MKPVLWLDGVSPLRPSDFPITIFHERFPQDGCDNIPEAGFWYPHDLQQALKSSKPKARRGRFQDQVLHSNSKKKVLSSFLGLVHARLGDTTKTFLTHPPLILPESFSSTHHVS